jgi:ubiquinone/menaquinone biosynthesis C-methylase UbiE
MSTSLELALTEFISIGIFNTILQIKGISMDWRNKEEIIIENKFNAQAFSRFLNCGVSLGFIEVSENLIRRHEKTLSKFDLLPDLYKLVTQMNIGSNSYEALPSLVDAGIQMASGNISQKWEEYFNSKSQKYVVPRIISFYRYTRPLFIPETILSAIKSGRSQWFKILGDASHPFQASIDQNMLSCFMQSMHMSTRSENNILVDYMPISIGDSVLDLGGGTGTVACAIAAKNSLCNITIFEPQDLIYVNQSALKRFEPDLYSKIKYEAGDFFCLVDKNKEKSFDHLVLGWILHDWNDESVRKILNYCYRLIKPDGNLYIFESILPENRLGRVTILDMIMLLQTEGKERTLNEYKMLLSDSGFEFKEVIDPSTKRQIIKARVNRK